MDDTRLKTLALGKNATATGEGRIEILIYGSTTGDARKAPPRTAAAHPNNSR